MKKGITLLTLVSALFLGNTEVFGQAGLNRANANYENLAYSDAIKIYEKVADRGFVDASLLKNIGNSYYFNGEYSKAQKWYERLFNEFGSGNIEPEYDYRYAETLQHIGKDKDATYYYEKFAKENSSSLRAKLIQSDKDFKSEIQKNSGRFEISSLKINSPYSDFGPSVHNNTLYYASARDTGNFTKRVFTWTGDAFTKVYSSQINADGTLSDPVAVKGKVNSKFNESSAVITKSGNTMYFTRNNFLKGKREYNSSNTTLLKIYKAELVDGQWTNITELPFNSNDYNTAHPVLNADETMMYFVSDRPGGFGASDIWKVSINGSGFSSPENLGPEINTDGRETFPFISSDNELYFASDARPGLGGLDVYVTKIKADGSLTPVQNIGAPVNSLADDFGFVIDSKSKIGYFSSNREGGMGKDDIYRFKELRPLEYECIQKLKVTVIDSQTKNVLTNAKLKLFTSDEKLLADSVPFESYQQTFDYKFECGSSYTIKADLPGYQPKQEMVTMGTEAGETLVTMVLEKVPEKPRFKKDMDLFKELELLPIHFDFDKSDIRPDAAMELQKIINVMKEHPSMTIDVRSYTDSRGSSAYNLKLSERRAKSTAEWIIAHGINASRLTYQGYGDTQLLNGCKKGVKCTEEEQAVNRRSEFIIKEI